MTSLATSGQCLCGNVHITVSGGPDFSVMCFCQDCQRISGGGSLPQAAFNETNVNLTGRIKTHQWASDAGNTVTLGFCDECGSPIYKSTSKMPGSYFISVGLLFDQTIFASPHLAYIENCQAWDKLPFTNDEKGA